MVRIVGIGTTDRRQAGRGRTMAEVAILSGVAAQPSPAVTAVELLGVGKRYGARQALAPTSLQLARGRTLALVGTSGSGKSTLLRLINGLIAPDTGRVLVEGAPLTPAARQRMGYVIQDGGLFPHLSALENVVLLARHLGHQPAELADRVRRLAELVRLPERLLDQHPGELSGGQRQRVSLMRALILDPAVLLLDEPLGALDPITRDELQGELRGLVASPARTTVVVTHDLGEAAVLADELAVMHEGAIVQRGTLAELARAPASDFVARVVGAQLEAARRLREASCS